MADDRLVNEHVTSYRTDDATVAATAIDIIAEGQLRADLIPAVMRLGMPFAIRGMTRQDRSAYRDQLVSSDADAQEARRFTAWELAHTRYESHLGGTHPAKCGCVDPGLWS